MDSINQQVEAKVDKKDKKGAASCPCCSNSDDLEQCKPYLDKSIDDRSKFLATKKLGDVMVEAR